MMDPDNINHVNPLLQAVQMEKIFEDGKTFVDSQPRIPVDEIYKKYTDQKELAGFNLTEFVMNHFELPAPHSAVYSSNMHLPVQDNIHLLWDVLTREPGIDSGSLLPLPYPYIVPGGRFGEIYYWDSFFTMLGLQVSGKICVIENMIKNFSHLINEFGYIPNGNRTYFLGRSQPPFFRS